MNEKELRSKSKFLSLLLRHQPELIDLTLNEEGWVNVEELLQKMKGHYPMTRELLDIIVETNDKKRFGYNEEMTMIRANQGHSIAVDLQLEKKEPPETLYHGTEEKKMEAIQSVGLQKMSRQHVHLSQDKETALKVGSRRGNPVILAIHSGKMHCKDFCFYLSENGVWLTNHVPLEYITK
ncbi:RNA 2'-phosphotransferase [Flavitalea flava]